MDCVFCCEPGNEPGEVVERNGCGYILVPARCEEGSLLVVAKRHVRSFRELVDGAAGFVLLIDSAVARVREVTGDRSASYSFNSKQDDFPRDHLHCWVTPGSEGPIVRTLLWAADELS